GWNAKDWASSSVVSRSTTLVPNAKRELSVNWKFNYDPRNWRHVAIAGYAIIIFTFGIVGGWAAVTQIDKAVVASAYVAIESNRKVVQHLEGGIVSEIFVREGQAVAEGEVLFRLDEVQAKANMDVARNQLDAALTLEARLVSELEESDTIQWPDEIMQRL